MTTNIEEDPPPMMACGHSANSMTRDGKPTCAICYFASPGADTVVETPDLSARTARCSYYAAKCQKEEPSSPSLAFFEHKPAEAHDRYYCGCFGWD